MEFKKLLNKVHDKVSNNSTPNTPVNSTPTRRQSFKDKKHATLSKWKDKWGDVSRPRFFNNNNNNKSSTVKNNRNDIFCPPLPTSVAALASPPPPLNLQVPTITISSPTLLKRSQSTIGPYPTQHSNYFIHKKQRPISYTPTPHQRLSVPHVIGQLPSSLDTTSPSTTTCDFNSSLNNSDDEDSAGSFYNLPILGAPPQQVTCYIPQQQVKTIDPHQHSFDDTTELGLDHESIISMSTTTFMKSFSSITSSSSSATSSSSAIVTLPKDIIDPTIDRHATPQFRGHDSAFLGHETFKQHKEVSISESDDDDDDDNGPLTTIAPSSFLSQEASPPYYELAVLNVTNTMMVMREHQLELQMTKTRIENQRLQQQIEDMISGTWTSTTHLLAENDRLEIQIQQLQRQQRLVRSSINNGAGHNELYWQDELNALPPTKTQLGLLKYLEGEPDMMAALDRFKKLLTTC